MSRRAKGFIVAAPASGSGKTLVTMGLVAAFARQGKNISVLKAGPDYIDPAFLAAACGADCYNLDPWAMADGTAARLVEEACAKADLVIIEGVMGLFDGPLGGGGATADLAARFGLPVVLVIDSARAGQSAGAVARGFSSHREDITVAGVICNRVASPRHERLLAEGLNAAGVAVLGMLPPVPQLTLQSRHLGLVQARERSDLEKVIERAGVWAGAHIDLAAIDRLALPLKGNMAAEPGPALPPPGQRIAMASDEAFAFAYPHLITGWRRAGAEIMAFSPLAGEAPSPDADAIFLPGGYPELHAGVIAANGAFFDGLRSAGTRGMPVYGECGGYMVLGEGLIDAGGTRHRMAGLLGLDTSFADRRLTLGYREATLVSDGPLGPAGSRLRGHEFHYATTLRAAGSPMAHLRDATGADLGPAGLVRGSVFGSFFHLIDRV